MISDSYECTKSELDLFSVPPIQTSIEEGVWDTIKPHSNFSTGTLRFDIPSTSSHYINLADTELYLSVKITKKDALITDTDNIGPVNNFFHSLFSQVEVYLNNTPVENTNSTYAYRAYFENLLCYNKEAKETFLQTDLFYKDTSGAFEKHEVSESAQVLAVTNANVTIPVKSDSEVNYGYIERRKRFINKTVDMKGRIHCDIFNINKYMINNVDISLKFTRTKEDFCLFGSSTEDYKVLIDNAFLKVRRQTISPAVMAAHLLALERTTAKYPIKRVVVLPITIPFKTPKTTLTGIYKGIMPKRVVLGLVSTEAFDGNKGSNPFNFQNFGVTNLCLKVASKALPYSSAFELDFENNNYIEAYTSLFQNIREAGNNISYRDYANGNTIYAFDLTPDLCSSEHFSLLKDGSLDLDIKFKTTPAVSTTAIFYLEFDNIIEIDKQRNILFDYKV